MTPLLSILIGLRDDRAPIEECLASLEPQINDRVEVVIADGSPSALDKTVQKRFPWVHVLRCTAMNAGELRREAFRASRGCLVALAEPHILFTPGWVAEAQTVETRSAVAVGGAVLPPSDPSPGSRAAFVCEYADFVPPLSAGITSLTTGNNVVYRRTALEGCDVTDGLWKAWVNGALAKNGESFWQDPTLVVQHNRAYAFRDFLYKRFHHGRCYAAKRSPGWMPPKRLAFGLATALIPALFAVRIARSLLTKPGYVSWLVAAQPWLMVFNAAWAVGEACGYAFGEGTSREHLY